MTMKTLFRFKAVGVFCLLVFACSPENNQTTDTVNNDNLEYPSADKIIFNANIYSFNWSPPKADGTSAKNAPVNDGRWHADGSSIVIKSGKISYVGEYSEALKWQSPETEMLDVKGATLLPGLIDSHVHIAELGEILTHVNLIGIDTPAQVIEKLKKRNLKAGEWIIGQGWDEGAWANNYPDRFMLDKYFPDNPVYLKSLHGFAVWANSKALQAAGISSDTKVPIGGEILTTEDGVLSGILLNRATTLMHSAIPEPTDQEFEKYVLLGLKQMAADGYVAVHQAGADSRHIKAFQSLREKNALPIRVYAMLSARDKDLAKQWIERGPLIDKEGWLDIRSVKAYYDGALGSRGARLIQEYQDKAGHFGVSGDGYGFDGQVVSQLMQAGFQVGIHAIGDAGNRETLDYLESIYKKFPATKNLRNRIEHAQVIHPDDFKRFAELSLIASMEPPHAVEDKTWAEQRLGPERIKGAYAWRSLRLANSRLTFNSDLPGSDHNIFYGLHAAVNRQDKNLEPETGWYSEQKLTMEESILAYSNWAAFAAFREKQTGILAPGYWADMTLMDIDPLKLAKDRKSELLDGKILMTIVNGKIVYRAKD